MDLSSIYLKCISPQVLNPLS